MELLDSSELFEAVGWNSRSKPDEDILHRFRDDDALEVPIELTDLELWANYTNDDLYLMDSKIREFLKRTRYKRQAKDGYRTTASMIFAWIYGRKPDAHDGAACRMIHMLLKYYCTSYTGRTTYKGKPVERVYNFSRYSAINRRPYSLRLRLEEANPGDDVWRGGTRDNEDKRTRRGRKDS